MNLLRREDSEWVAVISGVDAADFAMAVAVAAVVGDVAVVAGVAAVVAVAGAAPVGFGK